MFQYALSLSLREQFPHEQVMIDTSCFRNYPLHNGFEIDRIFAQKALVASWKDILKVAYPYPNYRFWQIGKYILPKRKTMCVERKDFSFDAAALTRKGNCYYDGYWQHEEYFCDVKETIWEAFSFPEPADGYVVDDVILSSDSITVYGSEESLDSIESLDIQDDIDVSDAKGDVTQNIDVTGKLPKGLSVSGESTITVKVLIKKLITRTFEYDASEVSLNDLTSNLDVQLVTKKVKVTLQGEEEVISQLTKDDMAISADLGKVNEGTTTVHVDVAVPDNTTLMNNVTIKIKAKAK